jgi:hypothetical protein
MDKRLGMLQNRVDSLSAAEPVPVFQQAVRESGIRRGGKHLALGETGDYTFSGLLKIRRGHFLIQMGSLSVFVDATYKL